MGRAPCCDKANVKRGPWSPQEDAKLKSYIENHGTGGNWIALPQKIGLKRCGKSCRLRWLNYLRPNIKHGGFTEDEDNLICNLYISIGSRWSIIAAQLPGRTDNDIKNYWNTRLKKKLLGRQRREHAAAATSRRPTTTATATAKPLSDTKKGVVLNGIHPYYPNLDCFTVYPYSSVLLEASMEPPNPLTSLLMPDPNLYNNLCYGTSGLQNQNAYKEYSNIALPMNGPIGGEFHGNGGGLQAVDQSPEEATYQVMESLCGGAEMGNSWGDGNCPFYPSGVEDYDVVWSKTRLLN